MAVVGRGGTRTAALLRALVPGPVVELTPCQAAFYEGRCRAVVVENFDLPAAGTLSGCAAARWALSPRSEVTVVGLDDPEGFLLGCRSFALSRHCILRGEILWIPPETAQRPPLTRCRSFLTSALDADCPLAFLNYSNGNLSGLDNWHWVPLVSAKGKKASFPCVILDEGQEGEIDFALWLKNTSLGGALVVLTPEE